MDHERMTLAVDIWQEIVQRQHEIMAQSPTGEIEINDARMWDECLDLLYNQHWELIFEALDQVQQRKFLRPHQDRMIKTARDYYQKHQHRSDRAMDINRNYKRPSWGVVMVMREIWQEI
jgi:hypothetical protein